MALLLHRRGIKRVRPLRGGLSAWRDGGFPLQRLGEPGPSLPAAAGA